jgi:hypothetical protein
MEDDPWVIIAIASLDDDRLAQHLLEFIALGTWAGQPFVVPAPLRSPHARMRLSRKVVVSGLALFLCSMLHLYRHRYLKRLV